MFQGHMAPVTSPRFCRMEASTASMQTGVERLEQGVLDAFIKTLPSGLSDLHRRGREEAETLQEPEE